VGFKYRKTNDWLVLNSKQEGIRLVGIKYQKCYDWLDLNSKQEGVQLVVFKYQMADVSCGEFVRQQRPDTKWVVHLLTNVTLYVNKLFDHPIGARVVLPVHILKNKAVVGLYTDNLCFFRCLAVHRGAPVTDVEVPANTYYRQYLQQQDMTGCNITSMS
jgi:hypothetical protein